MAAYLLARVRCGFQKPSWLQAYLIFQVADLVQGLVFEAMAHMGIRNQWLRHLIQPVILVGMLAVVYKIRPGSNRRRWYFVGMAGTGLAAAVTGYFINGIAFRNALFTSTQSLIYLTISVLEMRHLLLSENEKRMGASPEFWLYAALLTYASGTLLFNASSNYFLQTLPPHLILIPWVVVGLVHATYHILMAKVFLCPTPTSS